MNRIKRIICLLFILSTFVLSKQNILIINSYHKGYAFSDEILSAIEKQFYKNSKIETNILYMDSKRITSKEYFSNLRKLYAVQLKNRKYDLIIAIDRFAYDFVLNNYEKLFNNTHVLALGIENYSSLKSKKYNLEKVSVLLEKRDLKSNIELIEKSFLNLKTLYIINDKSLNAKHTEPLIQEVLRNHKKNYELKYLRANNLDELKEMFNTKDKTKAILFIRFYKNKDAYLNKNQEIASFIKSSKVAVFVTDSIFIKTGALAGKIIDLEKFGLYGALMSEDILKTKKTRIEVFKDLDYVFDEQKSKEFLIFPKKLLKEYILVNKNLSFYDKNKTFISFVFIISPFLIILIFMLIHNIYMKKSMEKKLKQRIRFDAIFIKCYTKSNILAR